MQANELSALDTALADLEQKHLSMKESYEGEIRRLRGQPAAQSGAAGPAAASTHAIGSRPAPVAGTPPVPPATSAQIPPYQGTLPGGFVSSASGAQQSALLSQPSQTGAPGSKFGARTLPAPQTQGAGRIIGIPSLPTAAPVVSGIHPVGGAAPAIPALTATPSTVSRGTANKMHPMGMMQSATSGGPSDVMSIGHSMKKEVGRTLGNNAPLGAAQATPTFGQPSRQPVVPTQAPAFTQSQQEDDYVVYQGRSAMSTQMNMKVVLQSSFPHDSVVCCVRYSWDGEFLATGSNKSAQIYEAATGRNVAVFSKDDGTDMGTSSGTTTDSYVRAVCFSPDGKMLITGAEDHVVKVWDVRNRTVKHKLIGHDTDIYSVDASPNGQFIISGSGDKKAKLWSLDTGKLLTTLGEDYGPTDGITSVNVSPTSQHVAAGSLDKIVRVWDVESGRLVRQFEGHGDSVYSVAFSPDGRMLLSGSLDKTLKLWDLAAQQPSSQCRISFTGHKDFVLSVAFSPNGRWLISGSKDRTVQFWDPRQSSMAVQLQGHKNSVISIAHNPRAKALATGSGDCRARTWTYT